MAGSYVRGDLGQGILGLAFGADDSRLRFGAHGGFQLHHGPCGSSGCSEQSRQAALLKLIPIIWVCLGLQFVSGVLLWLTKPGRYLSDGLFDIKMLFVILGFFMTMQFQKTIRAEAGGWDSTGVISKRGLQFVALTAFAWAGVLVMGRLTAYLGQLYHVS